MVRTSHHSDKIATTQLEMPPLIVTDQYYISSLVNILSGHTDGYYDTMPNECNKLVPIFVAYFNLKIRKIVVLIVTV